MLKKVYRGLLCIGLIYNYLPAGIEIIDCFHDDNFGKVRRDSDGSVPVSIFGAVPKAEKFVELRGIFNTQCDAIESSDTKVPKKKQLAGGATFYHVYRDELSKLNEAAHDRLLLDLFFSKGFDSATFKENVKALVQQSTETDLVHILLPTYFPKSIAGIRGFFVNENLLLYLHRVAMLFKSLYGDIHKELGIAHQSVKIVIPPLQYFCNFIDSDETDSFDSVKETLEGILPYLPRDLQLPQLINHNLSQLATLASVFDTQVSTRPFSLPGKPMRPGEIVPFTPYYKFDKNQVIRYLVELRAEQLRLQPIDEKMK